jgi:hypothetical protein
MNNLSHKGRIVVVFKIFGKNSSREEFFVRDYEANAIGSPVDAV